MPDVEGGRIGIPARQLRHSPGRLVQPQQRGQRPRQHRIEPEPRLPLQDQNLQQVLDAFWQIGAGLDTGGTKPGMRPVQQLSP